MSSVPTECPECKKLFVTKKENYLLDEEEIGLPDIIIEDLTVSRCNDCGITILHFDSDKDVLKKVAFAIINKKGLFSIKEWEWLCNYTLSRTMGAPWVDPALEV